MSFDSLIKSTPTVLDNKPARKDSTLSESFDAAFDYAVYSQNIDAREMGIRQAKEERAKKYKELTGKEIDFKESSRWRSGEDIPDDQIPNGLSKKDIYEDDVINDLKNKEPEKYAELIAGEQIIERGKAVSKEKGETFADVSSRSSGFLGATASFVGSIAGAFTDPFNLATLPLGAASGAGLAKIVATEAAINVGVEAVSFPSIKEYQEELGNKYGSSELLNNMVNAAVMGGAFPVGMKALGKTGRYVFSKAKESKAASSSLRMWADINEKIAFVKESNPIKDIEAHQSTLDRVGKAIENDTPLRDVEYDVKQKDFIESIHKGDGAIDTVRNMELDQIRGKSKLERVEDVIEDFSDEQVARYNEAVEKGESFNINGVDQKGNPFSLDFLGTRSNIEKYLKKKKIDMNKSTDVEIRTNKTRIVGEKGSRRILDTKSELNARIESEIQSRGVKSYPKEVGTKKQIKQALKDKSGATYKKMVRHVDSQLMEDPTYREVKDSQVEIVSREYEPKNDRAKDLGILDEEPRSLDATERYLDEVLKESSMKSRADEMRKALDEFDLEDEIFIEDGKVKIKDEIAEVEKIDGFIDALKVCTI